MTLLRPVAKLVSQKQRQNLKIFPRHKLLQAMQTVVAAVVVVVATLLAAVL